MDNEDIILFNKTNKNKKEIELLKIDNWDIKNSISSLNYTHTNSINNINDSISDINDSLSNIQTQGDIGQIQGDIIALSDEINDTNNSLYYIQEILNIANGADPIFDVYEYKNDWIPKPTGSTTPQDYFAISEEFNTTFTDVPPSIIDCSYDYDLAEPMSGMQNGVLKLQFTPDSSGKFNSVYKAGARVIDYPQLKTNFTSKVILQSQNLTTSDNGEFSYYIGISDSTNPSTSDFFIGFKFIISYTGIELQTLSKRSADINNGTIDTSSINYFDYKRNNKYKILIDEKSTAEFYINDILCDTHYINNLFPQGSTLNGFLYIYSLNLDTVPTEDNGTPDIAVDMTYIKEIQYRF